MGQKTQVVPELEVEGIVCEPEPRPLKHVDAQKTDGVRTYPVEARRVFVTAGAKLRDRFAVAVLDCFRVTGLGEKQVEFPLEVEILRT